MSHDEITIKVDPDIKEKAERLFASLGIDIGTAVNIFLSRAIAAGYFLCTTTPKPNKPFKM